MGFNLLEEDISHMIGLSPRVYTDYFLKKWDFDPEKFREMHKDLFYKNLYLAPYYVDTIELIKKIYSQGITLGLTTSAGREGTILILKKVGIDHMFKVIVTREDCVKLKPDSEPYILTAKKLEIEPKFCIVMEDTAIGVDSAKDAGMKCIAIPNEFTNGQDFSRADFVAKSINSVKESLEKISPFVAVGG
jgi:HAD superfamily hydrolase (TIGR01509 family)